MNNTASLSLAARQFLCEAETQPKDNYSIYTILMRKLESLPLESGEFEYAQRKLIDILEV